MRNHFERDTLANKLFLKKQYFRTEMKEGTPVETHLKHMKEITDKLAAIGAPISEEDQVVTLLGSLPSSYSILVTALEARVDGVTLNFVQQALRHEEQKQTESFKSSNGGLSSSHIDTALIGTQRKPIRPRSVVKCFGCSQTGHILRNCPRRKSSSTGPEHVARTVEEKCSDDYEDNGVFSAMSDADLNLVSCSWLVDSGASRHMTKDLRLLIGFQEFKIPQKVGLGDGSTVEAVGVGDVNVNMKFEGLNKQATLYNVLYVPKLTHNLFSVQAAASKGNTVQFSRTQCLIWDETGKVRGMGSLMGKLYQLNCEPVVIEHVSVASCENNINVWHQRLGHINEQQLKMIIERNLINGVTFQRSADLSFCRGCVEGKMHRKPFKPVGEIRSVKRLQLVHSDVCGPMHTESLGGYKYFVTFIDDYSRCCSVYFLKQKSEVFEKFKEFEAIVTNECGWKIGALRTDNGGEYVLTEFEAYLKLKGIRHEFSVPHVPEQNGVSERMNRTLMECARAMIAHAGLPNSYWAEAIATAAYVRNRMPTAALNGGVTPYERWYERKPNVNHLKVFGCIAYAYVSDAERRKLDKKAKELRFVGYSKKSKGYRLFDDETHKIIISRDVIFNETVFNKERVKQDMVSIESGSTTENKSMEESERQPRPKVRFGFDEYADITTTDPDVQYFAYKSCHIVEPTTLNEALASDCAKEWKAAADQEYKSLMENDTWDLVELPRNRKSVGCKWVFKVKYADDGNVERFKGRLVAKGYTQKYGIDYDETFSPVVRFSSIRALLAFAVQNDMQIHQMDVVSAFLNGILDDEIYMQQPDGYVQLGKESLVCKLKKSLYGLKQSPRCWNKVFHEYMESIGFKQSTADPCVYVRSTETLAVVAIYVDDLIIVTQTTAEMQELKNNLAAQFKMKDLGKLHYCLGISIKQDDKNKCLWLHQNQYIDNILHNYGLSEAKTVSTPSDLSVNLTQNDGVSRDLDVNSQQYQSMVGSLLYAAMATRPDIAQAVGVVSKFSAKPTEAHLTAVKRIFRYLKGTTNLALRYSKGENGTLTGYSDADWAGDRDDRHSTTGHVFLMSGGAVSWLSKKQTTVALSTAEAEYIALCSATQETVWLRRLLMDLNLNPCNATTLMEDNQSAIAIARNPVAHTRTKHIDIRYHYVREAVQEGTIDICYCPSADMIADILTKPLSRERFEKLRLQMGMNKMIDIVRPAN